MQRCEVCQAGIEAGPLYRANTRSDTRWPTRMATASSSRQVPKTPNRSDRRGREPRLRLILEVRRRTAVDPADVI
jgi:hypothetical protein